MTKTIIQKISDSSQNEFYIKREDLFPFSFGGNKARKAVGFFEKIDAGDYDCVVTYGSSSSNHCRVVSNMAAAREMGCYIISPEEASEQTFNSKMMECFGAQISVVPVEKVSETIDAKIEELKNNGKKPYFIAGGGHGNIGTHAYVECYNEIKEYECENNIFFDYIFHASGTGTTQAGLVCGMLMNNDNRKIIGISVARRNPRGRGVVLDSVKDYLSSVGFAISDDMIESATIFNDQYILGGYGNSSENIKQTIDTCMTKYGIPLDETYTGKAFYGMLDYLDKNEIKDKRILFIHTGGTPLFFDYLKRTVE